MGNYPWSRTTGLHKHAKEYLQCGGKVLEGSNIYNTAKKKYSDRGNGKPKNTTIELDLELFFVRNNSSFWTQIV